MSKSPTLRHISAVCILIAACILCAAPVSAAEFSGSGTADSPYLIQSNADMKKLAELVNAGNAYYSKAHYLLETDLALEKEEWVPIGSSMSKAFSGVFDGNGKSVTYIIEKPASRFAGLFGSNAGTIKNLEVKCLISCVQDDVILYAGGICGMNLQGTIENCMVGCEIHVLGNTVYVGGIAGYDSGGLIQDCSAEVEISAESLSDEDVGVGGIVGDTFGTVTLCNAYGTIYANGAESVYAGGIAGSNSIEEISSCTAGVQVTAAGTSDDMYAGGIVGNNHALVTGCEVLKVKISAECIGEGWTYTYAGGVAARNYDEVIDCTSAADVSAFSSMIPSDDNDNWPQVLVGGIAGYSEGLLEDCLATGTVFGEAEGEVFSDPIVGVNDGKMKNCSAENGNVSDDLTPSDDTAESPAPILGILGGLCAALVLRRR